LLDLVHWRGNGLLCFVQVESLSGTQVLGGTPGGPQASVPGGASRPGSSAGLAPLESLHRVRKGAFVVHDCSVAGRVSRFARCESWDLSCGMYLHVCVSFRALGCHGCLSLEFSLHLTAFCCFPPIWSHQGAVSPVLLYGAVYKYLRLAVCTTAPVRCPPALTRLAALAPLGVLLCLR
jgi:hypothetical protein